jgi:hypothetical protein
MRSGLVLACAAFAAIVSDAVAFMPGAALPSVAGRIAPANCLSGLDMMRHGNRKNKLALPADQRKALLRGLTTEIIRHGRITTTLARAKAVRGEVNRDPTGPKSNVSLTNSCPAPLPSPSPFAFAPVCVPTSR